MTQFLYLGETRFPLLMYSEMTADWYSETAMTSEVTSVALQTQAEVCNGKKLSARLASEDSDELFFTLFVMVSPV